MRLTLVRHGQTVANTKHLLQGHSESPLTELGRQQARAVGERLRDERIDRLYASDLSRAYETALEIAKHHPSVVLERDARLRERNFGIYEGEAHADLSAKGVPDSIIFGAPPNGETNEAFRERIFSFLDELFDKHHGESVVLVSHSGLIGRLLLTLAGASEADWDTYRSDNTGVSIIAFDLERNHTVQLHNCTEHLNDE